MPTEAGTLTFLALLLPFISAFFAPILTRFLGHNAAWVLALVPALLFAHFLSFEPLVAEGGTAVGTVAWAPSIGVDFSWFIDGLSLTFALLISGIGALIVLYSGGYLQGHPRQGRFFSFILLFMGSMQGLVLADGFITLFFFWELTSITSFLLIGFDNHREAARRAAFQALVVTGMGGLSLLAGLLVIWSATGAGGMSALLGKGDALRESPLYFAALMLVLGGAFTKSAQFPVHFWLPNAMEAPTPVSAYLHSATMVKAGVYLLMRLNPVMGNTAVWETVLPVAGGLTLIAGAVLAIRQTDLKLVLAYTTVGSLGLLVLLTGLGSDKAVEAAVLYLIAHSMFKGGLFMVVGAVDHEAGSRDLTQLAGLRKVMPITFGAALVAGASMAGLPLLFGFLAKEEIYAAVIESGGWAAAAFASIVALFGNAIMAATAFSVALTPFLGGEPRSPKPAHEGPILLWLGPAVLALLSVVTAVLSSTTHRYLSSAMASAVVGARADIEITTIPHLGMPLLLSVLTVALGLVVFTWQFQARRTVAALLGAIGWGPDRGFDQVIRGLLKGSFAISRVIQGGRLDIYMKVTFIVLALALLVPMASYGQWPAMPAWPALQLHEWAVLLIAVIGLIAVLRARSRLTAIVSLGIQGFAVALLFMLLGAPDLSFTQFMIETLSVVILALVMTRLRLELADRRPLPTGMIDSLVAIAGGLGFGLLLLKATQLPFDDTLSAFFAAHSRAIAHGRNIVNGIIVDFRGLDTLGEITVVMVAGLAILTLIRMKSRSSAKMTEKGLKCAR
ncbi:putative monovalent cation/H+ antiporter subunit A [Mesorhizobium sp. BAC0120]|uniref:putative monovalent cation/H+ antiporter subunit A n=1 Tax=Mesorhizobium sp. BAC0120 TaxID=3090670 RepID=UPI00298D40E6|nr:putative monovalent cation/H+ antiporter subunit A [Mesorhizobium sp. BAC0120]MDW6021061.1 putative monovalent cation/H+ antiporter subunit A [Mesorhizobium sp. BAC0120]